MKIFTSPIDRHLWQFPLSAACAAILLFCQPADSGKNKASETPAPVTTTRTATAEKPVTVPDTSVEKTPATENRKLIVYYFHGNFRCHSCTMIENLTKLAVESGFADKLKSGRVEMKVINIETPGNEHYIDDYKLYTRSVVLSDLKNGKEATWKNLDQVWTLLRDQNKFIEYIKKEITAYL